MSDVKTYLKTVDSTLFLKELKENGKVTFTDGDESIDLTPDLLEFKIKAKPGYVSASEEDIVVILNTELTQALINEGLARDLVRIIQDLRKTMKYNFTDRIKVGLEMDSDDLAKSLFPFAKYIKSETLCDSLSFECLEDEPSYFAQIGDFNIFVSITKSRGMI